MARQFRGRQFPPKTKVVNRHWTAFGQGFLAQAAGTVAATVFTAGHIRETCMRVRGQLVAWLDGNEAPAVAAQIGIGMILVPEGTGATVLWSPLSDADAPWMWYSTFIIGYEEMVTDVIDIPGLTVFREEIDNKAKRIVRPDVEVQLVLENLTLNGALAVNTHIGGRILSQQ